MKLVECVPNVSEGRDRKVIDALSEVLGGIEGIQLLDVDPGAATNRTVFTFTGPPAAVQDAAFAFIREAARRIDMRAHQGEHPRMGATDVCPFVPLGETTLAECVEMARRVGRRVGEELGIPVYLYEAAAASPSRRSLADIRRGEYEGLPRKLQDPAWAPDFGPAAFNDRAGATVIGAREFLIAYNVSLNTRDKRLAATIAQNIRETGRPRRGPDGKVVKDASGAAVMEPGPSRLDAVRATGWYIAEYGRAQVSINLTDFRTTPPHAAFEAVEKEAGALGLRVTGSEVVGLIPLEAVRMAGRRALARQRKSPAVPEPELVRMAVMSLGLNDVAPFDPRQKIIEYRVAAASPLAGLTVKGFAEAVSSSEPAPGGGSVAALAGSLAAALCAMVSTLTYEKKGMEQKRDAMRRLGEEAQAIHARLMSAVDEDTRAFERVIEAGRMPRGTEAERAAREAAVQSATLAAIDAPMSVMRGAARAQEIASELVEQGMASARSDAGVAALMSVAAVEGAYYNVAINLPGLSDRKAAAARMQEADRLLARARSAAEATRSAMQSALKPA